MNSLRPAALATCVGLLTLLTSCRTAPPTSPASPTSPSLARFEFEQPQMGLPFRFVLYAPDATQAQTAAKAAFARIQELNAILSDYDDESELSRLSRTSGSGQAVPVSPDLWKVLERAQRLAERSGGAFDVTVGPCVRLWRKARRDRRLPDPTRLAEALRATGYRHVRLEPATHRVELQVPNMRLDLGGIAKGYAVDEAFRVLRAHGISRALVAGAGDLVVGDPPPNESAWRVELPPLDATNAPPGRKVFLVRAALATSGDLFQRLEIDGRRYSHIVDPRTGIGLTDHSLVTVIGPDCMTADSLTKVVSVLGPRKGLPILAETRGVSARIVRQPGNAIELHESRGFSRYYTPPRPSGGRRSNGTNAPTAQAVGR